VKRYPQFIRHDVLQVDLARGIGMDYERIHISRGYVGDSIYVGLDRPRMKELHAAGYFLLERRPYGVTIVIYEGTEEWHNKLTLKPNPWEQTEMQERWNLAMYREYMISVQRLYEGIPDVLLVGADPSGLQAQAES